jgi:tRNA-splicing ligase RtcB
VNHKLTDQESAVHAAATGQAMPGRQIRRTAPLVASPFVTALVSQLPEQPAGKLRIANGIAIWGDHDAATLAQIERCADDERVVGAAIAADGHRGYAIPIGGIIAYEHAVSPNGVGFDIGCGIKAVKTDMRADDVLQLGADGRTLLAAVMDDIAQQVAFGMGRTSGKAIDHALFDAPIWREIKEVGRLRDMAANQLGTVGGGNHFVDLSRDNDGWLWIVCHFGSRGLGHKTATGFLNLAAGRRWDDKSPGESSDAPAVVLPLDTELGQQYMAAMELGGTYAYAGRDFVAEQVRAILGASVVDAVHNHHNYAFREHHGGKDLIVVRKGATPARPGVRGIIAGSMGTPTAIVRGVASPEAAVGFHSAPHGSGRVMSRTQAAGKRDYRTGKLLSPGRVTPQMLHAAVTARGIELRGGGLDESPHVYRNIDDVLAAHAGVIEVETRLFPMGVAMAGDSVLDPFKD